MRCGGGLKPSDKVSLGHFPHTGSRFPRRAMRSNDPIFIGGMFKSGTSLLRAMLGHHSRFFAGLETQWVNERWDGTAHDARRHWLERLSVFFDAPVAELEKACGDAADVETSLDRLLTFLAARAGKERWVEKTPGNVGAIERILANWPNASILHIIRDPRDVYASMLESRKWTVPEEFASRWTGTVAAARKWLEFSRRPTSRLLRAALRAAGT